MRFGKANARSRAVRVEACSSVGEQIVLTLIKCSFNFQMTVSTNKRMGARQCHCCSTETSSVADVLTEKRGAALWLTINRPTSAMP